MQQNFTAKDAESATKKQHPPRRHGDTEKTKTTAKSKNQRPQHRGSQRNLGEYGKDEEKTGTRNIKDEIFFAADTNLIVSTAKDAESAKEFGKCARRVISVMAKFESIASPPSTSKRFLISMKETGEAIRRCAGRRWDRRTTGGAGAQGPHGYRYRTRDR